MFDSQSLAAATAWAQAHLPIVIGGAVALVAFVVVLFPRPNVPPVLDPEKLLSWAIRATQAP